MEIINWLVNYSTYANQKWEQNNMHIYITMIYKAMN